MVHGGKQSLDRGLGWWLEWNHLLGACTAVEARCPDAANTS